MKAKRLRWALVTAVLASAYLLLDALFLEKYFFEIKHHHIGPAKGGKPLKIVLITDLHLKWKLWPYYKKLANTLNSLQPHLILIAGDTLNGHTHRKVVEDFFGRLSKTTPKAAILGNHDHEDRMPVQALREIYQEANCDLLVNRSKTYNVQGERITITGLDDFIEGESCVREALEGVGKESNHLLLIHSPLQQEPVLAHLRALNRQRPEEERINIRYIFAGHNHGGQVRFGKLVPKLPLMAGEYVEGWYNSEPPYLFLSKGFGTSTVPFRFGARAELNVFFYHV